MKLIRKLLVSLLVLILVGFTVFFVLDAYNTGKIGDKAGKISTDFTQDIVGTWNGKYSISQITFNDDGTTSLTMLGVVLEGEYSDSYDLQTQVHTIKLKYTTSVGLSVERYFEADLVEDKLTLVDTQLDSVKMVYTRGELNEASSNDSEESTTLYNPGLDVYKNELLGVWEASDSQNSGYEFRENSSVYLKLMGIGYEGNYSVSIEDGTNRCVVTITYASLGGVSINNSYYVSIEDGTLTLTQKGLESFSTTYMRAS